VVEGVERARVDGDAGGLVVLVGLEEADGEGDRAWMAEKVAHLRIFADGDGKMNRSVIDVGGTIMLVPNFTVAGSAQKGRRPGFDRAMRPERAEAEFGLLVEAMCALHPRVTAGVFRTHMRVTIVNDGPVTILLDSRGGAVGGASESAV